MRLFQPLNRTLFAGRTGKALLFPCFFAGAVFLAAFLGGPVLRVLALAALAAGLFVLIWKVRCAERAAAEMGTELAAAQSAWLSEVEGCAGARQALAAQKTEMEGAAQILAQTNVLLAQASGRFQELFQGLPVACFCYDRAGRIMEWNRAFERLYGLEDALGRSVWETVCPRDGSPQLGQAVEAALAGEAQEGIEWTHRRADGSPVQLLCNVFPLRGLGGEVTGGISVHVDISAQHRAEEALRASEERLHALYNTTSQQDLSFADKTAVLLETGCLQFGLETGVLARAVGENYHVVQALSPDAAVAPGVLFPADAGPGRAALCLARREEPGAESGGEAVCLGSHVRVNGEAWGTLCFVGAHSPENPFTSGDREMVRLMAQWIGGEVARREAEEAVRDSEERFRSAIASMSEGLILMDAGGVIRICNESAERILGVTRQAIEEWRPLNPEYVARREDGTPFPQGSYPLVVSLRRGAPQRDVVAGLPRPDGSLLWVTINSTPLFRPGEDAPYAAVATFSDITERRRSDARIAAQMSQIQDYSHALEEQKAAMEVVNAQLEALALCDGLTGLGNRRAFEARMEQELLRAERYGLPLSLVLLDVDGFKEYNDTFGHPAGDQVLRLLSKTVAGEGRETDFFARYGGEEFVILLPHTDSEGAVVFSERLRSVLEAATWPGRDVTASFGVATLWPAMQNQAELVSAADTALYAAKAAGRNRVVHAQALFAHAA